MSTTPQEQFIIQSLRLMAQQPKSGKALRSIFDTLDSGDFASHAIKPTEYQSTNDSLAISCVIQRMKSDTLSINSEEIDKHLTDADIFRANVIRDYYQKRIMIWKLKSISLSKFRKDLESYIVTDGKVYHSDQIGMIRRLPYFYDYDVTVDRIRDQHFSVEITDDSFPPRLAEMVLYPVESVNKITRARSGKVFWFNLDRSGIGVSYFIDRSNQLLPYFDSLFKMNRPMMIRGRLAPSNREGFQHYALTKIEAAVYP